MCLAHTTPCSCSSGGPASSSASAISAGSPCLKKKGVVLVPEDASDFDVWLAKAYAPEQLIPEYRWGAKPPEEMMVEMLPGRKQICHRCWFCGGLLSAPHRTIEQCKSAPTFIKLMRASTGIPPPPSKDILLALPSLAAVRAWKPDHPSAHGPDRDLPAATGKRKRTAVDTPSRDASPSPSSTPIIFNAAKRQARCVRGTKKIFDMAADLAAETGAAIFITIAPHDLPTLPAEWQINPNGVGSIPKLTWTRTFSANLGIDLDDTASVCHKALHDRAAYLAMERTGKQAEAAAAKETARRQAQLASHIHAEEPVPQQEEEEEVEE